MSIKLLDTIYKLTDNADKVDGKHASDFATSGHTHNYAGSSSAGGAATSANKLATARTITLSGSVTGSTSFDGSGNVTISTTTNHGHSYASKVTVGSTAYKVSSNNITIPAYPTSLKCPNSLTIQGNGTSLGSYDGSAAKTINITPAAIGAAASSHTHSGYLPRLRMTNPDPGHANVGAIPHILALKSAGTPVYGDPEFKDGVNNVYVYNNSGNGTVTISHITDNQNSGNSSGKILKISTTTGTASPGRGGFYQNISARAGAVFCQIFRAKIPTGFSVVNAENSMGTSYKTYWMTDTAGTGKWEWYCRITSCGTSGTMSGGGHVYLSGSGAVTWYLSYCNLIDLTKGNYDGLRAIYSDTATKLGSNAGSATNPIYFSGGKPVACTYSLNKTVPSNAIFTDTNTTYSAGTGLSLSGTTFNHASSVTAGTAGTSSATSGSTLAVPYVTVNATGHVTGYGTHTHTVSGFAASSHSHSSVTDYSNGTAITFQYSTGGFTSNPSWLGAWNGYQLTYVSPSVLSVNYANSAGSAGSSSNAGYCYVFHNINNKTAYPTVGSAKNKLAELWGTDGDTGIGRNIIVSESVISQWGNNSASTYDSSVYSMIKIGGGYNRNTYGQYLLSTYASNRIGYIGRNGGNWTTMYWLATTSDLTWNSISGKPSSFTPASHNHSAVLDIGNSTSTTFAYSKAGLNYADYTWLAAWNGYELRAVNKSQFAQASHTHNYAASSHTHKYAGSSSAGGAATSANKLNTNAGSATKPVYFSGGVPVQVTGCMVQYWAIYEIFFGKNGTTSSRVKQAGNFDFLGSVITHERVGQIYIYVNYPAGFSEKTTMIFGNGDHVGSVHTDVGYLTIGKQVYGLETGSGSNAGRLRLSFSDDASTNWGYAYLYFLCIS